MNKLDPKKFILLLAMIMLAAAAIFGRQASVRITCRNSEGCERMSSQGVVTFEFSRAVDPEKAEKLWQTEPAVVGRWEWLDEKTVRWSLLEALTAGSRLTLRFNSGDVGRRGERIKSAYFWDITIRPAHILALGQIEEGSELFELDLAEGAKATQLTQTGGNVFDYAPSPDGERIAFSAENEVGGLDLWVVDRDGGNPHLLLDCQTDRCSAPDWSPSGTQLAYTREAHDMTGMDKSSSISVWILDWRSGMNPTRLSQNDESNSDAKWSPDGRWISVWNIQKERIDLVNLESGKIIPLETRSGNTGCWSADGRTYYYSAMEGGEGEFQNLILKANTEDGIVKMVLEKKSNQGILSVDNPACDPSEGWLAVRIQPNINVPGYELAAYNPQSEEMVSIQQDYSRIISSYAWSPDGRQIILQTFPLGGEVEDINIWVWDRESGEIREISSGGFRIPKWLP